MQEDWKVSGEGFELTTKQTASEEPKGSGDLFRSEWQASGQKTGDQAAAKPQSDDRTQVTDKATPAANPGQDKFIDPYEHIKKATNAAEELDKIAASGKSPTDMIEVTGPNGQVTQVKVEDRVTQLKTEVKSNLERAKLGADNINQTGPGNSVSELIKANNQKRDALCAELGIDKSKMTNPQQAYEELNPRFLSATPENRAKLQELWQTVRDRADLETLRHAPAYQRLIEAELTAKGYANPSVKAGQETPREDIAKAFTLLKDAGRIDEELSHTELFRGTEARLGLIYAANQQDRSVQILTHLREAGNKKGNAAEQEAELKKAVELADKINIGFITTQARIPRNLESGISQELVDIATIGSSARLDYAKFLQEQGRFNEAQALMTQVKTDSPELIYQQNPKTKEITYRDAGLATLDQKISLGVKTNPGSWDAAQTRFIKHLQDGDNEAAKRDFAEMQRVTNLMKQEVQEANKPLKEEKARLDLQRKDFEDKEKKKTITEEEKVELERVKREMDIIDKTMEARDKQVGRQDNITRYMDGLLAAAQDDRDRAHNIFKEVKERDPELAKIKELDLDGKIKDTEGGFSGWWHRNWKYVAVGAAVVAGVAIAVGTCGVASGASAALIAGTATTLGVGTGTAATIVGVGTFATATALGATGGGLAHLGVERTVNKDAGLASFMEGAKVGGLSAAMVASPWASGMLASNGVNVAIGSSKILAGLGVTKLSVGAGVGLSGTIEGGRYLAGQQTGKEALINFGIGSVMNTALIGAAGKMEIVSQAGKMTLPQALGAAKTTAAWGFGISGVAETANVAAGNKTLEQGAKDFVTNGTINTAALGFARYGGFGWKGIMPSFNPQVGQVANPFMQSLAVGGKVVVGQEGVLMTVGQFNHYLQHDLAGEPVFQRDTPVGFAAPLMAGTAEHFYGSGLNLRHRGERSIFQHRVTEMGNDFGQTTRLDRRFVDPRGPYQGLFFQIEPPKPTDEQK